MGSQLSTQLREAPAEHGMLSLPNNNLKQRTKRAELAGLLLVLLGCVVLLASYLHGMNHRAEWTFSDLKPNYSGARCLFLGCNPYDEEDLIKTYTGAGGSPDEWFPQRKYNANYLPPAIVLTLPFAVFPWEIAKSLWTVCTFLGFTVAAILMWDLARAYAPMTAGALIGSFVASSAMLLRTANPAGIAISFCAVAVWCFVRERYAIAGVLLLAISLAFKPHDSALIWLWLLLGTKLCRRRALQSAAVFLMLCVPAVLWFWSMPASSHWVHDLHANLAGNVSRGFADDPGPENSWAYTLTNLQTVVAVFKDDPRVYNPAVYLITGGLLLLWLYRAAGKPGSRQENLLALAFVTAVSLLPLYHRQYDTRLLLMLFPATAVVWAAGGILSWCALLLAAAGIAVTSSRMLTGLNQLPVSGTGILAGVQNVLFHRPLPLLLLVLSLLNLVLYLRCTRQPKASLARGLDRPTFAP